MSLYPETILERSEQLQTIDELIAALKSLKTRGGNHIDLQVTSGDQSVTIEDALIGLSLVEKTLSDGSKMHDIRLSVDTNTY